MSKLLNALALATALLGACKSDPVVAPTAPVQAPLAVTKAPDAAFYGVVTSAESRLVTAELDGAVRQLFVRPGQPIKAGATIAILDDSQIAKQIEEARGAETSARGSVLSAKGQVAEASRRYAQLKSLLASGAVARDQVKSAGAEVSVLSSQVQVAEGRLTQTIASREQLEAMRSHATIVSPIDGIVSLVKVSEGQMAGRGMPIARVSNPAGLKLRFAVPREQRDQLVVGARVDVTIKGQATAFTAIVKEVGSTLEPPLQFAVVEAELVGLPADQASLLGALAEVRLAGSGSSS